MLREISVHILCKTNSWVMPYDRILSISRGGKRNLKQSIIGITGVIKKLELFVHRVHGVLRCNGRSGQLDIPLLSILLHGIRLPMHRVRFSPADEI